MKDWQFLIQKQGERSWNPLESPNLEISAGKYRLVARSNLANTDVEVRVTHSSILEVPPKRRVQKRTCRTNADGLIAVIPFTFFKPGVWEIQCSGDLMSDILGQSWQFRVELQVLPQKTNATIENSLSPKISVNENSAVRSQEIDAQQQSVQAVRRRMANIHNAVSHAKKSLVAPNSPMVSGSAKQAEIDSVKSNLTSSFTDSNKYSSTEYSLTENNIKKNSTENSILEKYSETLDNTEVISLGSELEKEHQNYLENEEVSKKLDFSNNTETENTPSDGDSSSTVLAIVAQPNSVVTEFELETEGYTIIDEPVSPVWLKSSSVEHILQNLIDLALPNEEYLLASEPDIETSAEYLTPSLPLHFTLVKENYVAHWGEYITIEGSVGLKEETGLNCAKSLNLGEHLNSGKYSELDSISAGEIKIELRSPLTGEILHEIKQSLPKKILPFDIACSIQIPPECESKLILASISLSGMLGGIEEVVIGEAEVLATHPFTITANITELLAVANSNQSKTLELTEIPVLQLAASDEDKTSNSSSNSNSTSPLTSTSTSNNYNLDLEFLNLVKSTKSSTSKLISNSVSTKPSPSRKSAPKSISYRISQEPRLRNSQQHSIKSTPLEEYSEGYLNSTEANNTTFPFLRRLPIFVSQEEAANNNGDNSNIDSTDIILDNFECESLDASLNDLSVQLRENEQVRETEIGHENISVSTLNNLLDKPQLEINSEKEENSNNNSNNNTHTNIYPEETLEQKLSDFTETISTGDLYASPLIRQWMESHGHTPPQLDRLYQQENTEIFSQLEAEPLLFEHKIEHKSIEAESSINADTSVKEIAFNDLVTTPPVEFASSHSASSHSASSHSYDLRTESSNKILQLTSYSQSKVESALLAKEIVVDDIDDLDNNHSVTTEINPETSNPETSNHKNYNPETYNPETSQSHPLFKSSINSGNSLKEISFVEPLPTPKLQIPQGELISGSSIRIRVKLPEVEEQVAVKLWLEDCETRSLLSGPNLITNLLPNSKKELEAITLLHIPFGCLRIRIEAIAIDLLTQQESHKFSILREVIPPNLPKIRLDELMQI